MKQVTRGVRNVMQMADRQAGGGVSGSRPELVGRDAGGRFVGAGGNGSAEAMARMKIALSPAQRQWVDTEATRRHVPKTVIVRELLDRALTGGFAAGGPEQAHDVGSGGVVEGVADLGDAAAAGPAHVAAGGLGPGSVHSDVRVPEVEVVGPEPVHDGCAHAGVHGRQPHYHDPALAGARAAAPPRGVRPYTDPSRRHGVEGRVAVESVRQAVGDPSAGASSAHTSQLPPGVGASRPQQAVAYPAEAGQLLEGLPPGVSLPGGMRADMVTEGADSKSLVVSGGRVATESGVVVMLPGERPGDPLRAVRIPLASYVKGESGAPRAGGFFSGLPQLFKYSLIVFGVLSVLLGFLYLGSGLVANSVDPRFRLSLNWVIGRERRLSGSRRPMGLAGCGCSQRNPNFFRFGAIERHFRAFPWTGVYAGNSSELFLVLDLGVPTKTGRRFGVPAL